MATKAGELSAAIMNVRDLQGKPFQLVNMLAGFLKNDADFKASVKGEQGLTGPTGSTGQKGTDGKSTTVDEVVVQLLGDSTEILVQKLLLREMLDSKDRDQYGRPKAKKLSQYIAENADLQQEVTEALRTNPGNTRGPQGERGPEGPIGNIGPTGPQGTHGRSPTAADVASILKIPLKDLLKLDNTFQETVANSTTFWTNIAQKLKQDGSFKQSVKGDVGPAGLQGPIGPPGPEGKRGDRGPQGPQGIQGTVGPEGKMGATGPQGLQGLKGDSGADGAQGEDADPSQITHRLAHSSRLKRSLKGEDGKPGAVGPEGKSGKDGEDADPSAIAYKLSHNTRLKRSLKGEDGEKGGCGERGEDGKDANPAEIARELVTNKGTELGEAVLDATGSGGNLATQMANQVNLNIQDLVKKIDITKLTEGIVSKLTPQEARQITHTTVDAITRDATKRNNPDPHAFKKYEKFAEKLAELLLQKSAISQSNADSLVRNKVSDWGLAKYLLIHANLNDPHAALPVVEEKASKEKLAEFLLQYAGLDNNASEASASVDHILKHFFSTRAGAITAALRSNPGRTRGPKGEDGEKGAQGEAGDQGSRGQDGKPGRKGDPGEDGAPGQDADPLQVTHKLAHNTRLKRSLKGETGEDGVDGAEGPPGEQGARSRDGKPGKKGDHGEAGEDGATGANGATGPIGPQGSPGEQGPRGRDGKHGRDGGPG